MKKILLILTLCLLLFQAKAQKNVNFSGEIKNLNPGELIYLGLDGFLLPLKILENGTFSVNGDIQQTPSFVYFAKITERGKIEQQTPLIWFERDSVRVTLDWFDKSFKTNDLMPFQAISEKIEASKTSQQNKLILNNPNTIPSIFFAERNKDKMAISELENIISSVNYEFKSSIYFKRLQSYISAKKRKPLKKGKIIEDFKLKDKNEKFISVVKNGNKQQLIAFLSSGCPYSIESISLLEKIAELNNDRIELITIWGDPTKETWLNTYQDKKDKITWTNLWDEFGFASTYMQLSILPTFYVISDDGKLKAIIKGYDEKTKKKLLNLIK